MFDDDLTQFLATPKADALGFRQGVIVAWNVNTGQNTINCAGAVLTDVPFMASGGLVSYSVGDVVVLFRQRSSWAILSRIANPGGVAAIGRNTQATQGYVTTASNFGTTTGFVTKATLNVAVPAWANAMSAQVTATWSVRNSTGSTDQFQGRITDPSGSFRFANSPSVPTVSWGALTMGMASGSFLVTPGGTATFTADVLSGLAAWAVNASNAVTLEALVTWNSN